jgi:hypothetical protein
MNVSVSFDLIFGWDEEEGGHKDGHEEPERQARPDAPAYCIVQSAPHR